MRFVQRKNAIPEPIGAHPAWFSALLRARGISGPQEAEAFLHPSLDGLHDPFLLDGMEKTVILLKEAIRRKDPILVWGDYDADGVCAASILLETLLEEGAVADVYLPSRHGDGYGLNADRIREKAPFFRLLITVDCGISNVEEVALAKSLGLTVIITDHHEPPETLPPADVLMNPLLGSYPYPRLCGAGVALKIAQAFQGMEGIQKRLDLAALATVADIVPLQGENRVIVSQGLRAVAQTRRPGLRALMELAGIRETPRSDDLAFRLGPRINAAGRMAEAMPALRLLTTRDETEARVLARLIEENNRQRQEAEAVIHREALACIEADPLRKDRRCLIACGEGWNPGLIGLAAGRIAQSAHLPTVILAERPDGSAVGSCRSIPGVHLYKLLCRCDDLLLRYGGHEQAAGLSIAMENLPAFQERINRLLREQVPERVFVPFKEYDLALPFHEWTPEHLARLETLEPTGCENPVPAFLLSGAIPQSLKRVGREGAHLKFRLLEPCGLVVDGIAFGMGGEAEHAPRQMDVIYRPTLNSFGGRVNLEAQAEALRAACPFPALLEAESREDWMEELQSRILSDEELREIYRLLRRRSFSSLRSLSETAGFSEAQITTALTAFRDTGLISWSPAPFSVALLPPVRCRMIDSPLVRYLRETLGIPLDT